MFLQILRNIIALFTLTAHPPTDPNRGQFYFVGNDPYAKGPDGTQYALGTGQEAGSVSQDLGDVSGAVAINLDNGRFIEANQTGNITAIVPSNANERDEFVIYITQGSGGPYTFAHDLTAKLPDGFTIDPGDAVGEVYGLVFSTIDGGTTWFISQEGGKPLVTP